MCTGSGQQRSTVAGCCLSCCVFCCIQLSRVTAEVVLGVVWCVGVCSAVVGRLQHSLVVFGPRHMCTSDGLHAWHLIGTCRGMHAV
jgi:hypothetical protein